MDDDKLIDLIKERSSIYDKTNKYYTNKSYVQGLWKEIANEMHIPVPACQKRWRYLRDYFVRQLHMAQNGTESSSSGSNKKKSLWALFDRLEFLAPFSSTRRAARPKSEQLTYYIETSRMMDYVQTEQPDSVHSISSGNSTQDMNELRYVNMIQYQPINSNFESNDEDESTLERIIPVAVVQDENDEHQEQSERVARQSSTSQTLPAEPIAQKNRKRKRSDIYDEIMKVLKTKREEIECDEHEHFFKSLLASVRKIDEEHIMSFRTEVLQVIMKYMYMSQGDNLVQPNGNGQHNSDVVVIETGELHWRKNLGRY